MGVTPGLALVEKTAVFNHNTDWYSYWTNDVGIVDDGSATYIIACFLPVPEEEAGPKLKELSQRVYEIMRSRSGQ